MYIFVTGFFYFMGGIIMGYKHLNANQRFYIEKRLAENVSKLQIAKGHRLT
jgi:hypothetical protein